MAGKKNQKNKETKSTAKMEVKIKGAKIGVQKLCKGLDQVPLELKIKGLNRT